MKFAGFEYNRERGELCFQGERVPLQEQPLQLLGLLLEQPSETVSRERIREALWSEKHGDHEHGINTAVRKLRRVLEREQISELRIVTSAGRGYRLLLPEKCPPLPGPQQQSETGRALQNVPEMDHAGHQAFITGRFLFSQRNPRALFAAKAHFELACERMPDFALAHASLSRTCRFLTIFEASDPGPLWEQAERHARCAVALDSQLSEAHSSLACVLARYRWEWGSGCVAYRQALRLNPDDVETLCDYGVALLAMGEADEGARQLERVLLLDPQHAIGRATVALGWLMQGRKAEAVAMLIGMTEVMPGFLTAWIYLGIEQINMADWAAAERSCEQMLTLAPGNPTFLSLLAHVQAGLGKHDAMRATVEQVNELSVERYVSPTARGMAALAEGDTVSACNAVQEAAMQRDANFALYSRMRLFDPIRTTPDFVSTLAAMRLEAKPTGYWSEPR